MEQRLGRFRVLQQLGEGGMGEVFLAQDLATRREVALKRLRAGVVSDTASLVREFSLLAKIRHPTIVEVFDCGYQLDGTTWYSMEYVPGTPGNLAAGRNVDWVAHVATSVITGLEALHSAQFVHGDLKPSNILIVGGETNDPPTAVKIVDFGLASHVSIPGHRGGGTAGYTAPEVVHGSTPSYASDLFSFGCCLTYFLTGHSPFEAEAAEGRNRLLLTAAPSVWRLEAAGAPGWMISLILRLLASDAGARPRSAREVRHELQRVSRHGRPALHAQIETAHVVGRERELASLEQWIRTGEPLLALIGEPGMGRSAVLDAFASRMTVLGRRIIQLDGTLGNDLLPALRIQLADCVEQTVIVLLDDADGLAPESRRSLCRLAIESAGSIRVLLACEGLSPTEEPIRLAGELAIQPLLPLRKAALHRLVSARLGRTAPAALANWLWSRAAGHPGLTLELLRLAVGNDAVVEDEDELRVDRSLLASLSLPANFLAVHRDRLKQVSPEARRLALALALRGGSARADVLLRRFGPQLGELQAELCVRGLLIADLHERLILSPTLVSIAIDLCEPSDRADLHAWFARCDALPPRDRFHHLAAAGQVEDALEVADSIWSVDPNGAPAAEAAELAENRDPSCAADWYDRAIQQAWSRGAHGDAQALAQRVVLLDGGRFATAERWERLAAASFRCGALAATEQALTAGLGADPAPVTRGRLLIADASLRHARGNFTAALKLAEAAIQCMNEAGAGDHLGDAALTASSILISLGRWDDAESRLDQASDAYSDTGQQLGSIRAAQLRGMLLRIRGEWAEAEKAYLRAFDLARESGLRLALQETHMYLGQLYGDLGRGEDCRASYQTARRIALEDGRGAGVALATLNLAQYEGLSDRPREAIRLAHRAVELARAYLPGQEFLAWRALVQGLRALGRLDRAINAVERMMTLAVAHGSDEDQAWCRVEACRLLLERGQSAEALRLATRSRPSDAGEWNAGQAMLECLAGRAALQESDRKRASAAAVTIRKWLDRRPHKFVAATASHLEAELALRQGRIDEACQHLTKSVAAFAAIPCIHERAMVLLDTARLAAQPRGDSRVQVSDWLSQAAQLFASLGNRRRQRQAAQLEAEWLRRRAEFPALDMEHGLLERVGRMLHVLTNYGELTGQALALAVEQFNAERGVLLVEDPATRELEPVAHYGAEDAGSQREVLRFSRSLVRQVASDGKSVLVSDALRELESAPRSVHDLNLRAFLGVPMFLHGRVVGAVYLDSRKPWAFAESDRRLLEGFAQLMVEALESSRAAQRLTNENMALRREASTRVRAGLVGSSRAVQQLLPEIERAASSVAPVLLTGETGTGKDLVAKVIHQQGRRSAGPFVSINCGAFPIGMLEPELFGIGDHAFTGVSRRPGRFQKAKGGTLFLDEIGEMPLAQQVTLLSAIDNHEITPLGEDAPVPIDVRIIAATNRDLEKMVEEGTFRKDLFFRLNVLPIRLPTLRERKSDIPELAHHFASQIAAVSGRGAPELAHDLLAELMSRDWSGNVRELENYIERLMTMREGDVLHAERPTGEARRSSRGSAPRHRKLVDELNAVERRMLVEELRRCEGNQSRAARALGLTEATFRNKLSKHGIWSRRKLRNQ